MSDDRKLRASSPWSAQQNLEQNLNPMQDVSLQVVQKDEGTDFAESISSRSTNMSVGIETTAILRMANRTKIFSFLIVLFGCAASAFFLFVRISSVRNENLGEFDRKASELVEEIKSAWNDYEVAGLWVHEACRSGDITRQEFRDLHDYLQSNGLEYQAISYIPNVTHAERVDMERASEKFFYQNYTNIAYRGIVGLEPVNGSDVDFSIQTRSKQPFYFPVHFVEPIETNEAAVELDLYSLSNRRATITSALSSWEPALTARLQLVQETDKSAYSVLLFHPGIPLSSFPNLKPRDLSSTVIRIPSLLARATKNQMQPLGAYVYDTTEASDDKKSAPPQFLGGVEVNARSEDHTDTSLSRMTSVSEMEFWQLRDSLGSSALFKEQHLAIASRTWSIIVVSLPGTYQTRYGLDIFGSAMIFFACSCLALWMYTNMRRTMKLNEIQSRAKVERDIVSSLFPSNIRDRIIQDAANCVSGNNYAKGDPRKSNGKGSSDLDGQTPHFITSEGVFGSKPIADFIPEVTLMFGDLAGFTAWSSVKDPTDVFTLLETIYYAFDNIAKQRKVFKLETVGDCYVAVAGLSKHLDDHAVVMAEFASDCVKKMKELSHFLEVTLGPDTGDLELRVGLHSGPVTAGVLRGDKGRFQLFGDTMNTASRMESTGLPSRIHVSDYTAALLKAAGKGDWLVVRHDKVFAKGKGELQTFWLDINGDSLTSGGSRVESIDVSARDKMKPSTNDTIAMPRQKSKAAKEVDCSKKIDRLVDWNVEVLKKMLRYIIARRSSKMSPKTVNNITFKRSVKVPEFSAAEDGKMVLDEIQDIISIPKYDAKIAKKQVDPDSIELDEDVTSQLKAYVHTIANMYSTSNPFHNFEHASHVIMSVTKLLRRIVNPKEMHMKEDGMVVNDDMDIDRSNQEQEKIASGLHDYTFGITSDPLTQFACVFSALIHDADHPGVPNATLVKEKTPLAQKYKNKSVAEQNSVDIAWNLLTTKTYEKFFSCIFGNQEELVRFRQLVVNMVMATDIMDKDLGSARKARWAKAFADEAISDMGSTSLSIKDECQESSSMQKEDVNRKATIVIEHLIQASDVAHTMQHWHVFCKWNERLFHEMYRAYKDGHIENDPSLNWYEGEKGFFDFYIIPLAKKLETCGVFGVSSDECLSYAVANRKEWEIKGLDMVKSYIEHYEAAE